MLLNLRTLQGISDGTVSMTFRRWRAARVKPGTRMRTQIGVVEVTSVERVDSDEIGDGEAREAGFGTAAEASAWADKNGTGELFRIGLRFAGEDPRITLRDAADLSAADRQQIREALARLDRAAPHPCTGDVLRLISARPAVVAAQLAEEMGLPRDKFKRRVWRLKELGLTESLDIGYRLSPRGIAYLAATT